MSVYILYTSRDYEGDSIVGGWTDLEKATSVYEEYGDSFLDHELTLSEFFEDKREVVLLRKESQRT